MTNTNYTKRSAGRTLARLAALLLIFVASFTAMNVSAQTTVTIGSGTTTTSYFPIYTCYGYSYSQQIYTAAEMTAGGAISGGQITQVKFMPNAALANANFLSWTVYLGNTASANLSGTTGWIPVGSMTQVFSGNIPALTGGAWMTLNLTTPFTWTGGNLVVAVDENTAGYTCTAAWRSFTATAAAGPRGILYYSDTNNPSPAAPPTANYSSTTVRAQIQMTMTGGAACSGTPNAGTASASVANACAGSAFSLSATGITSASGMNYQWQVSTNGGSTWNNIAGATTSSASVSQSVASSYKLVSTCTSSGQSASSNVVSVGQNAFTSCYPSSSATSTADEEILNVTLGGINQSSVCGTLAPGAGSVAYMYSNYRGVTGGQITQGATENFSLNLGYCGTTAYSNMAAIYIDYNQNGSFADAGEQVYTKAYGLLTFPSQVVTGSFVVPTTATLGQTGVRVVYVESSVISSTGTYTWGETEDYLVTVAAPAPMTLNTINTQQQTGTIGAGTVGAVIRVNVKTDGVLNPLTVNGFQVSTTGTTDATEIVSARMYYTGVSGSYATTTAFGSPVYNPTGTYQITGSQVLSNGNNHFFLAYEMAPWITACNHVADATVDNVSINNAPNTVANNNPAGAAPVVPPIIASNLSPVDGFSQACRNVTLSWTAVAPYTAYDVYVDGSLFAYNVTSGSQVVALAGTHTWELAATGTAPSGCFVRSYTAGANLCYCVPSMSIGCTDYDVIGTVQIADATGNLLLSNVTGSSCPGGTSGYSDYTTSIPAATMSQGNTYTCTVRPDYYSEGYAVWIDGNDNGAFEASERVGYTVGQATGSFQYNVPGAPLSFPITLTCGSPLGQHRMRVRCIYATNGGNITPCNSATYGETEDYTVNFVEGVEIPAVAAVISGPTDAVCNSTVTFTATNYFNTIQWQYSTDFTNWVDITGATNATQGLVPSGPAFFALRTRSRGIGCVEDVYSDMVFINVVSPTVSVSQSATTICRGTSATLTATSDYPNAVYTWSNGQTGASITVSPLVETTYTVTVGGGLCTASASATIAVSGPTATMANVPSTTGCPGTSHTLTGTLITGLPASGGYSVTNVPFSTLSGTGNAGPSGDDVVSGSIALPFPFTFYGTTYNSIVISTNGFISFDAAPGSGCCSGQTLPSATTPNNVIALGWDDLNAAAGQITYFTSGNSFVVDFNGVPHFGGSGTPVTGQIVLNADNTIQINSVAVISDGSAHTQGIENADGTLATTTPGANGSTTLSLINQSYQFAPPSTVPFTFDGPVTYSWNTGATSNSITVAPDVTTTYTLTVADNSCSSVLPVTVNVHTPPTVSVSNNGPICNGATVSLTASATSAAAPVIAGGMTGTTVAYNTVAQSGTVSAGPAGDDVVSGAIALPFPFTFYGTTYNNVYISTNGFISFTNAGAGCCSGQAIPNTFGPVVALGWTDLNTSNGGNITYWNNATQFVVSFNSVAVYSGSGSINGQIVLNADGSIDINSASVATSGTTTQGINAGNGSAGVAVISAAFAPVQSNVSTHFANVGGQLVYYAWNGGNAATAEVNNATPSANTTYSVTVTDSHGCTASGSTDVTVVYPSITCPATVYASSDAGVCGASVNIGAAVAGAQPCDVAVSNDHPSTDYPVGTTVVTWTATDDYGNTASCTQSVVVTDVEAPVISGVNASSTIECPEAPVFSTPTVSDNCGANMTFDDVTVASCGNTYSTTRTWTAVDAAGNTTTASETITVQDVTAPDIAINDPVYLCFEDANPTLVAPNASDACNSVDVTRDGSDNYPVGLTTVTWTATDACGNARTSTQDVLRDAQIDASFSIAALPGYCQGGDVKISITSTGGTGSHTYLWSNGATTATVTVPNNATYTCTVTDDFSSTGAPANCSRTFTYTANLNNTSLLSSYTILGTYDVHIHGYQTILNGGVGATAAVAAPGSGSGCTGGRIKMHRNSTATGSTTFLKAKCVEVDATSASANTYTGAAAAPPMPVFDAGIAVPTSAPNVTVAANTTVTLSGTVYGNIQVKAGGKLTFLHATIDCKMLQVMDGATLRGDKACTRIRVEGKFQAMKNSIINPAADNHDFAIYVDNSNTSGSGAGAGSGGSGSSANTTVLIQQSAKVKAFIYAPNGGMEVHGPGGNGTTGSGSGSGVHSVAPATSMTGLFIARNVNAHGRTTWNWNTACATCNYTLRDGEMADNAAETLKNEDLNAGMVVENFPDPFTDKTNIRFVMANDTHAQVDVFDLNGKFIKSIFNGDVKANQEYRFELDGTDLSNGMYIYKVVTPSNVHTGKMLLIKQ